MCGIAGFTRFSEPFGDKALLTAMGDSILHRGPDAHGEYLDADVGLCHRRLSIIDLSSSGNQPMLSADGNLVLVFNGEIYNFQTLRKTAEQQGYRFRTKTDTEVILAMYQLYGPSMVEQLNGMFAIALWDKKQKKLFLARDRLGKKPLYYYQRNGHFVFASEIKAILTIPFIPRSVCHEAVYDFFTYQYIPDPKTIFNNVFKLPPGHWMQVSPEGIESGQYWDVSFAEPAQQSEAELTEELHSLLETCTRDRMISDVPLGAFLSGGVDSSGIVALMALNQDKPVTTCSIGFDSKKYDEVQFAKQVATQYNTDHHEFTVRSTVQERLKEIACYFDEPFADPSLVPTFFVSELAKQKVTVALAGDGGDENFAGYSKYTIDDIENRMRRYFPPFLRQGLFPGLARALSMGPGTLCRKGATLLNTLSHAPDFGFYLTNTFCSQALWDRVVSETFSSALQGYHPSTVTTEKYQQADGPDHLSKILYTDIKTYLTGDILVKVDRMSMANSLEVRAPILDYRVVEFAAKLPAQMKYRQGEKKYLLKQAFAKMLPDDILYRKKMGFSVPLASWLRNEIKPLVEETLWHRHAGLAHFFDMNALKKVWQQHQVGRADHSSFLWSALMFELWWQEYMR